ncbi:MAG: glycosyltransferase [Thermoplasmata archaeon]|nr:glycosyltransferase [Thermoplasmata archaeon]
MTDSPLDPPGSGSVTVIVTVRDDPRLEWTLESLLAQTREPQEILIADGGDSPVVRTISERFAARSPAIRHLAAPGTIAESRNIALGVARSEFIAFLDTDEVAPSEWLQRLTAPFFDAGVGFVGGPTPAMKDTARNVAARYYDAYLRRFYDHVAAKRTHALPMGNSAWRGRIFRELGLLDLSFSGYGNEDQEMALRALRAGWRGLYVPAAPVLHDFSDIGWWSLFRKQLRYARGGYLLWRRTGSTYEASAGRILPYLLLPVLGVLGAILLSFPALRLGGAILLLAGFGGLGVLALGLTVQGRAEDAKYPGYRYRAVEIWRRWATLFGAFVGALSPERSPPAATPPTSGGKL